MCWNKAVVGIKNCTYICLTDMPTLFYYNGFRFFFYSDEHLPEHIHVENGDGRGKISLNPDVRIVSSTGIKKQELKHILKHVCILRFELLKKWREYHG